MEDYAALYTSVLTEFFRAPTEADSCSELEIAAAEKRLKLRLPRALREFFACAGKMTSITRSQNSLNHLTRPTDPQRSGSELAVKHGHLYFFEENQGVVLWCVNCSNTSDDPSVFQEDGAF